MLRLIRLRSIFFTQFLTMVFCVHSFAAWEPVQFEIEAYVCKSPGDGEEVKEVSFPIPMNPKHEYVSHYDQITARNGNSTNYHSEFVSHENRVLLRVSASRHQESFSFFGWHGPRAWIGAKAIIQCRKFISDEVIAERIRLQRAKEKEEAKKKREERIASAREELEKTTQKITVAIPGQIDQLVQSQDELFEKALELANHSDFETCIKLYNQGHLKTTGILVYIGRKIDEYKQCVDLWNKLKGEFQELNQPDDVLLCEQFINREEHFKLGLGKRIETVQQALSEFIVDFDQLMKDREIEMIQFDSDGVKVVVQMKMIGSPEDIKSFVDAYFFMRSEYLKAEDQEANDPIGFTSWKEYLCNQGECIKAFVNSEEDSWNKRIQSLKDELDQLRVASIHIGAISAEYSQDLSNIKEPYESLLERFVAYQSSEALKKSRLAQGVEKIEKARGILPLFELNTDLDQLRKEESSAQSLLCSDTIQLRGKFKVAFQVYKRKIAPFDKFMTKYQLAKKMDPPKSSLEQLETIQYYSNERNAYFSEQVISSLRRIEKKMRIFMNDQVASILSEQERKKIRAEVKVAFHERINELMDKEVQLIQQSDEKASDRQKIKPKFEIYREILSYQDLCSDLEQLYQEGSPYYAGCEMLQPLFHSAHLFMERKVWREMKNTISFIKKSGILQLQSEMDQLTEAIHQHEESRFSNQNLLDVIRVHDYLIEQFKELNKEA